MSVKSSFTYKNKYDKVSQGCNLTRTMEEQKVPMDAKKHNLNGLQISMLYSNEKNEFSISLI